MSCIMEGTACKQCAANGRKTTLRLFQINLEEAVWMCPSKECTFPMRTMTVDNLLVKRNISEMTDTKRRRTKVKCPVPVKTTPRVAHTTVTPTRDQVPLVTEKASVLSQAAESSLSTMVVVPSVTKSQPHASYVIDRGRRNKSTSPSTLDSSQLTVSVPSPTEVVFSPSKDTDTAALPVSSCSSSSHSVPKTGHTSAVCQNPGLASLLTNDVAPNTDLSTTIVPHHRYLQWSNVDALCWMDVALCLLVHCNNLNELVVTSGGVEGSLVRRLLVRYKEILTSWDHTDLSTATSVEETKRLSLQTSVGRVSVKTGGGGPDHLVVPPTLANGACAGEKNTSPVRLHQRESCVSLETVCQMLADVRADVLACKPKLNRERGHEYSPVCALPLLLDSGDRTVLDHFRVEYCWHMTCTRCHHCHEDRVTETVPTFPAVSKDFAMSQPCFLRPCSKCHSPGQRMNMHIERMPSTLVIHFAEGLSDPQLTNYDFQFGAVTYAVTGLIQHKTTPDHFIAWIRDVRTNHWMKCDDLQSPVCEFSKRAPSFPPSQVHIVMWERQSRHGNPVATETTTNSPIGTHVADGLTRVATQTTTVPPGVATGLPPGVTVLVAPALIAGSSSGVPQQPGAWVTVSPVGMVAPSGSSCRSATLPQAVAVPAATTSRVTHSDTRTKSGKRGPLTERLQRCREKFERAKAIRPRAVTTVVPPTVIYVPRPAQPSAQTTFSQSAVTVRSEYCNGQLPLVTPVSSSHKPQGTPPVACSGVRAGLRVSRSVPVFAGYRARAQGHKSGVSDANCSGETNGGVKTSSPTDTGANASTSLNSGDNTSTSLNGGFNSSPLTNRGANSSSSVNTGVNTSASLNNGVNTPSSAKSSVTCITTAAVSKKRVVRQSGSSDKRRKLSPPPVLSTHATKCVTSSEPETCHQTQDGQESECVTKQVDTTSDIPDKLADVLDELCSTLDISDVSQRFDCDDVIDFESLLTV